MRWGDGVGVRASAEGGRYLAEREDTNLWDSRNNYLPTAPLLPRSWSPFGKAVGMIITALTFGDTPSRGADTNPNPYPSLSLGYLLFHFLSPTFPWGRLHAFGRGDKKAIGLNRK